MKNSQVFYSRLSLFSSPNGLKCKNGNNLSTFGEKTGGLRRKHNPPKPAKKTNYAWGYALVFFWDNWGKLGKITLKTYSFPHSPQVFPQGKTPSFFRRHICILVNISDFYGNQLFPAFFAISILTASFFWPKNSS